MWSGSKCRKKEDIEWNPFWRKKKRSADQTSDSTGKNVFFCHLWNMKGILCYHVSHIIHSKQDWIENSVSSCCLTFLSSGCDRLTKLERVCFTVCEKDGQQGLTWSEVNQCEVSSSVKDDSILNLRFCSRWNLLVSIFIWTSLSLLSRTS